MARSGLDSLLEALRQSGMDTGGMGGAGGGASASGESADGKGAAAGGGKGETPHLDLSFLDNMTGPTSKKGWIILAVVAVLVLAALYWWFHPPISINSSELWMIVGIICIVVALFFYNRRREYKMGGGKFEKSPGKAKRATVLVAIPLAVVAVGLLGALFSNAIIPGNAEKYSTVLETDTLDFAEDIHEVDYNQIPVIDRDSAILIGDREMGSIPEYVSQFEISPLYSQIKIGRAHV